MRTMSVLSTMAVALATGPGLAQTAPMATTGRMDAAPEPCPATPAPLPAGWTAAVSIRAAAVPGELATAMIEPGRGVRATLSPADRISYPVAPGHPGEEGMMGGMLAFAVERAGTYRVALGAGAWIDVARDGHALVSIAHGHGPACSPIRKTVDFTLAPGRYLLEVTGNKTPTLALMVAPVLP